jgi:hypothetical protein
MSQASSEELLLRFKPCRENPPPKERDKVRDALQFLARKFGWDVVVEVREGESPESTEP